MEGRSMFRKSLILSVLSLMLIGCGASYNSNGNSNGNGNGSGGGGGNTAGQVQGIYSGTVSSGYTFTTIVLPNDKFYAVYGTVTGKTLSLFGLVAGQGTSSGGTYTASVTDYFYTGAVNSGSINAKYGTGDLNGSLTENVTALTFTGTALPPTSPFDYGTLFDDPASLSAISGTWTGTLLDGMTITATISSSGSVTGSSSGCSFTGAVAPDSSKLNFFNVSLTFGGSPCAFQNQTATGVGVEYLLSDGITHQLLAAVTAGTSTGTVFAAAR
jgi:hypothetical protein